MNDPVCGKCGGAMEQGFLVDNSYGAVAPPEWAEGEIKRSMWTGVEVKNRERHTVTTHRCTACGYLESFAL